MYLHILSGEKMASPSGDGLDVEDYVLDEIFSEWGDSPPTADHDDGMDLRLLNVTVSNGIYFF